MSVSAQLTVAPPPPPAHACVPAPPDLICWWPGEGSSTEIWSGKDGEPFAKTTFGPGKAGQAFSFDGNDGFVEASIGFPQVDNWSVAAWIYWRRPAQAPGQKAEGIIYHGDGDRNGYGLYVVGQGWCEEFPSLCPHVGELTVLFGGVAWNFPGVGLDANAWNHVVVTRREGVGKLYKNGRLVWSQATPDPVPPSSKFDISTWPPFTFNGEIDEVCVFGSALSDELAHRLFAAGELGICKPANALELRRATGGVELRASARTGQDVSIDVSTDLRHWEPFLRLPNPSGMVQFAEPARLGQRFYRLAPFD